MVRQLSELLRLPYDEVYSDFDAICPKNWERKGVTGAEIREFCAWRKAPLYIVNCRGQMLDCYEPAVREQRPVACCIYRDHAFFYRNAGAVSFCDGEARDQPSYRGDRRESTVPLFREWKQWCGEIEPGHFWCEDVRVVRAELLGQGHQPKVAMRGLVEWRDLRLRAKGGDCVVHEYPEDAELMERWMTKLDFGYRGQRLAAAASASSAPGLLRPEAGPCMPGVPPLQDLSGVLPRHEPGEPVLSLCPRDLRLLASAAAAGLQNGEDRSRQGLSGRGHRLLPQERPRQRTVSPAGLLPAGQHPARRGRTPRGPHLRAQEGGPARGPGRAAPLRRPRLVRQARDGLHARHRTRQLGGLRVVPGRHRPRLAGLPRPGTGDHGESLARGRGAHGQTGRQRSHRPLGSVQGRLLLHAHVQSRGGRPGLPVPAGLLRRPGPVPLRPRLRHGALLQPLHAARPRFRNGFGVRGDGEDPPGAARGAASLPGGDEDRLPGLSEPSAKVRACGGGADQAAPPGQHAESRR